MATIKEQLLSRTVYDTDGTTTVWNFAFSGGYLDPLHVKAYTETPLGLRTQLVLPEGSLIGEFQLRILPALVAGNELVIYRDTPKNLPLVDFTDESGFSEIALDTNAKQAVFIAAEAIDTVNALDVAAAVTAAEAAAVAATNSAAAAVAAAGSASASANSASLAQAQVALAAAQVALATTQANNAQTSANAAAASAASIVPANFVQVTGDQSVAGVKTFTVNPISSAAQSAAANSLARRDFVTELDSANVKTGGDQSIGGVKTFSVSPVVPGLNGGQLAGFRNLLINGNFAINQRGYVSNTIVGSLAYTLDRWRIVASGTPLVFSPSGNGNQITAPSNGVEQIIEGANIGGGTYVLNWTGTATATVNGTPLAKGASFTLTAGTNATVRLIGGTASRVQLEPGTVATPFEHRPIGVELAMCQRYFWRGLPMSAFNFPAYSAASINTWPVKFPVTMRAVPTVTHNLNLAAAYTAFEGWDVPFTNVTVATTEGARLTARSTAPSPNTNGTLNLGVAFIAASAEL